MTDSHDKMRGDPPYFKSYPIETPAGISTTKFDLTSEEVQQLYDTGEAVGRTVDWEKHSSSKPIIPYYDPKPHEALEFSLRNAHQLWNSYADAALWVDSLDHQAEYMVRIHRDWTVQYDRIGQLRVSGNKSLFLSRLLMTDLNKSGKLKSLAETPHVCEEIKDNKPVQLIRVPAFNTEDEKGFVIFYIPPISKEEVRTIHTGFTVPKEFAKTLAMGLQEKIQYGSYQLAHQHQISLQVRILVDTDLPELKIEGPCNSWKTSGPEFDDATKRDYRVYQGAISARKVVDRILFEFSLSLNPV